jgi:Ca-activated chloride channel homolog
VGCWFVGCWWWGVVRFGSPFLLLFLVLVPVAVWLYGWGERRRRVRVAVWASPGLLGNMVGDPGVRRRLPAGLFLLGVVLLLVGFARPEARFSGVEPGGTVVVAVDDSGSMAAADVAPSRLAAADGILAGWAQRLPSRYRLALVVFSEDYSLRVPPGYDRALFVAGLPRVTELEGTALGDAAAASVRIAVRAVGAVKGKRPPAAVLVVSDGGQNAGELSVAQAAAAAKKAGVPVSTLLLGTAGGVVNQRLRVAGSSQTFVQTTQVPAEPAALKQLAAGSGGVAFDAATQAQGLAAVEAGLGQRLVHERRLREVTAGVTAAALVLILTGAALSSFWFRRLV